MEKKLYLFLSLMRPAGPVVVGISLGFTISLLCVTWVEDPCGLRLPGQGLSYAEDPSNVRKPNEAQAGIGRNDNFEPKIIQYTAPNPQKAQKAPFRTRYISAELNLRERLFVGVLTSRTTLSTLAIAVNRTLGHRLEKLVYFTGTAERKLPHGMHLVVHGDERPIWNMYQTVKHLLDHYTKEYDWFYLVQDDTYTEAHRISKLAAHLSIDADLYLGRPEEFIGGDTEGRYCYGGFGYFLSRSLLLKLQPHLESCRNDILSARPDEWLGRCIIDYTHVNCVEEHEGIRYRYFELGKNVDLEKENDPAFKVAFTAHPVLDPVQMYRLQKHFAQLELEKTYQEIEQLQREIQNTSSLTVDGEKSATWPLGINRPFQPRTRFEVLKWDYFTEDHTFSCIDGSPKCELLGADLADVTDVLTTAIDELNRKYQPVLHVRKQQLLNGYRRFDPTRGMEYTLDLQLELVTQKGHSRSITKRVHLVRPLSEVEITPMPYVTEGGRINIILPVTIQDREYVAHFIQAYAAIQGNDNCLLTLLFVYDHFQAQQVGQNDVFGQVKGQVTEFERKYRDMKIPWISVKTDAPSQIRLMDIISKKHPVDTLFFLASVDTHVNIEFLNRCRMNTINNWQVFFPIHFQGYNPEVSEHGQQQSPSGTLELLRDAGRFDRDAFDEACFYNVDYMAARSKMAVDAQDNEEIVEMLDIYEMFIRYSGLHVFRAVEPALLQKYRTRACNPRLNEEIYHRCVQSNLEGLGSRSQLAMLLFEQEQGNST